MGFLTAFVRTLCNVFCVSSPQQGPPESVQLGAEKPPYVRQTQHEGSYLAQHQQSRPPQQYVQPPYLQLPPQQHDQRRRHKAHQSHGYHERPGQSSQGPSSVPSPPPAPHDGRRARPLSPPSQPQGAHQSPPSRLQGQSQGPVEWLSPPASYPPLPQAQAVQPTSPRQTQGRIDRNLVNSQNEHYVSLRARAKQEGDAMALAFEQSHAAHARKDGAAAKELSDEAKEHQREMERLNAEASAWIFRENNLHSKLGEVDLHGLYVKEAIAHTDRSIAEARARNDKEIRLIVGKGNHSENHMAKVKPAIEGLMQECNLSAEIDPQNPGVLIVQL